MSEELIIGNMSVEMGNPGNSLVDADGLVRNFNRMLLDADEQRQMLADARDWEKLAHGLASFRSMKAALDVLIRSIEDDVAAHLPDKKVPVQGLGLLGRDHGILQLGEMVHADVSISATRQLLHRLDEDLDLRIRIRQRRTL